MNRLLLRGLRCAPQFHRPYAVGSYHTAYVLSMPPTRALHSSKPVYGVMDNMKRVFSGAEEKREQAVYDVQQRFLLNRERPMNGDAYLDLLAEMRVASGMSGVKEHLPWVASNPGLQDFKDREAVLCALTPAERRDLSLVRIAAKKRIAAATGKDIEFIESLIDQVETMKSVRDWLIKREDDGLPLPKDSNEMRGMLSTPGAGMKRSRKGRGYPSPGLGKMSKRR